MIKNLRSIFMVALMAVSGSLFAQNTTETKGELIDMAAIYQKIAEDTNKDVVYGPQNPIEQNGISIVFDKATGSANVSLKKGEKFLKLFAGKSKTENIDGNTMTFKADKYITKISIAASDSKNFGKIKADCGTIEMTGEVLEGNAEGKKPRPAIDPVWTNVENGKVIDVKEVKFTIYRDADATADQHVRYAKATVFTSEALPTGITNIAADKAQNGVRYNLAGQRVSKDFKGVVIENGKKMIVK